MGAVASGQGATAGAQGAAGPPASNAERDRVSPLLVAKIKKVQQVVSLEAYEPLVHGRICLGGLTFLELLRGFCWTQGSIPGYTVLGMHFLSTISDIACILFSLPLFSTGTRGQCVQLGCLGPMLTLVFAMSLVDVSALTAYLVVATPRPLSPDSHGFIDVLEACIGVWEFAIVASVALQVALCLSTWRIYRGLRAVGLYPPDSDPAEVGKIREVSVLEVVCEAEDVELLANSEIPCCAAEAVESESTDAPLPPSGKSAPGTTRVLVT